MNPIGRANVGMLLHLTKGRERRVQLGSNDDLFRMLLNVLKDASRQGRVDLVFSTGTLFLDLLQGLARLGFGGHLAEVFGEKRFFSAASARFSRSASGTKLPSALPASSQTSTVSVTLRSFSIVGASKVSLLIFTLLGRVRRAILTCRPLGPTVSSVRRRRRTRVL